MAPTQISGSPWQSAWNSSTVKKAPAATTFAASVGDLIVVLAANENGLVLNTPTNAAATSPASITWTSQRNVGTSGASCRAAGWTGVVTAAGNVQVQVTEGGGTGQDYGIIAWAFNAHGGVGQTVGLSGSSGSPPSLTPGSPWTANSTVCAVNGDWSAVSHGATRSYRTNLGAATERNYVADDGSYTTEAWEHADSGASPGSGAIGLTTPNMTWSMVGVEILGVAGTTTYPRRPVVISQAVQRAATR